MKRACTVPRLLAAVITIVGLFAFASAPASAAGPDEVRLSVLVQPLAAAAKPDDKDNRGGPGNADPGNGNGQDHGQGNGQGGTNPPGGGNGQGGGANRGSGPYTPSSRPRSPH